MPTLEAPTEKQLLRYCAEYIACRGGKVQFPTDPAQWLTPKELGEKVGLKSAALFKRLRTANCPAFEREKGKKRITRILCHQGLIAFLQQPKQPGRRLAR